MVHVIIINGGVQERGEWVQTIEGSFQTVLLGVLPKLHLLQSFIFSYLQINTYYPNVGVVKIDISHATLI